MRGFVIQTAYSDGIVELEIRDAASNIFARAQDLPLFVNSQRESGRRTHLFLHIDINYKVQSNLQ